MSRLVAPSKALGYSRLYLDFLAGNPSARQFFLASSLDETVAQLDRRSYDRRRLIDILTHQNREFGASTASLKNIEKLADSEAVCIISGQQAGLFGHSLLVQIKALALVKKAQQLSLRLNRPVVPIFWIAGDDHDFGEVAQTTVLNREGSITTIAYRSQRAVELPIGETKLSDESALATAISEYRAALGDSEFTPELYAMIEDSYTTDNTFVAAFGKLMARLTARYGLVYFSPSNAEVKKLAEPFLRGVIGRNSEVRATVHETNDRLVGGGFHLQVEKSDHATFLFYNGTQGRKPVTGVGDQFVLEGENYSLNQLQDLLASSPERFSPDVILRPVMQSYLFPVLAQYGGPSEIAYLAQLNRLFGLFDLPTPHHLPRPTATLIEKRFEKIMSENGIAYEDLTGDVETVVTHVLEKSFPPDLERRFQETRSDMATRFEQFTVSGLEFDSSLKDFAKQTAGKIDFSLKSFEDKVFASHKKKSKETRERIYRLQNALFPNHAPQDRTLNIGYFIAKYGAGVISFLHDHLEVDETSHQLLYLSEMTD